MVVPVLLVRAFRRCGRVRERLYMACRRPAFVDRCAPPAIAGEFDMAPHGVAATGNPYSVLA
jgi:hypothetical protein